MPTIQISLENIYEKTKEHPICQSRVCENIIQGIDCGSEVSEWLSLALGKPNLRLIRQNHEKQKKGNKNINVLFNDNIN